MTLAARFLDAYPHHNIARLIQDRLARCREARIVAGFATPDGVAALKVGAAAPKITRLVLGAGTFKAFEALDSLIASGLPASAARLHLGYCRATGWPKNPFERLRPMLHSKIYYFEMPDGTAAAFVGSHNLTGFALRGRNGEAAVLLEGPASDPGFADIRAHIEEAYRVAVIYDAALKAAYATWYADYLDRLKTDITDMPRTGISGRSLVVMAEAAAGIAPALGQAVYFEVDRRIQEINSIQTQVHLHLFPHLPATPRDGLASLAHVAQSFRAKVQAIDVRAGSAEIDANWFVDQRPRAELKRAPRPFRPHPTSGKQQVTALIEDRLAEAFAYEFDPPEKWLPQLADERLVDEETDEVWNPVVGLQPERRLEAVERRGSQMLMELSPDSGSFILLSRGRRRLNG
ncbi:phospholipase D family protein [Roseomonas harenae]|uniref:phospholipase D family protein n=1 Tax=Muricoccus harenae TaxID=2692566 RepID=UPI001331170C|nr:phospholipase D family protein [Roseomonas harenae]